MSETDWQTCDWETWKAEALRIVREDDGWAESAIASICWDSMREMFFDDEVWRCSPREAWDREYDAAQ